MTEDSRTDVGSDEYEPWMYPEPIQDLEAWVQDNWEWFDPIHAHATIWPDRPYQPDIDILVAGCGSSQAAVFALTNRAATVTAIDTDQAALDHAQSLKDTYGLSNLELYRLPIDEAGTLRRDFDLIVSTGALNTLRKPAAGMKALGGCLREHGALGVMLYAKYGRIGIEMLQSAFSGLGLGPNEASVEKVRETISALPSEHPVQNFFKIAPASAQSDVALANVFLRGRERSFTVAECIDLVDSAGLVFQGWLLNAPYYPHDWFRPGSAMDRAINAMPDTELWSVVESLHVLNASHFFLACRPDRPKKSYIVDFSPADSLDYVPLMRMRCGIDGQEIFRPNWRTGITPAQSSFVRRIDGDLTIREIVEQVMQSGELPRASKIELEEFGCKFFEALWRLDFIAISLAAPGQVG
ncbi:MAG: class I SAM-dependent methyltransferase [Mycobacterium sp.]